MCFNIFKHIKNIKGSCSEMIVMIMVILVLATSLFMFKGIVTKTINKTSEQIEDMKIVEPEDNQKIQPVTVNKPTTPVAEPEKKVETQPEPKVKIEEPKNNTTVKTEPSKAEEPKSETKHDIFYDLNINIVGQILGSLLMTVIGGFFLKSRWKNKEDQKLLDDKKEKEREQNLINEKVLDLNSFIESMTKNEYNLKRLETKISELPSCTEKNKFELKLDQLQIEMEEENNMQNIGKKIDSIEKLIFNDNIDHLISDIERDIRNIKDIYKKEILKNNLNSALEKRDNKINEKKFKQIDSNIRSARIYNSNNILKEKYKNQALSLLNEINNCKEKLDYLEMINSL